MTTMASARSQSQGPMAFGPVLTGSITPASVFWNATQVILVFS